MSAPEFTSTHTSVNPQRSARPPLYEPGIILNQRYQVEACIGRGGFGEVYRVFDLNLSRRDAMKVLYPPSNEHLEKVKKYEIRFLNEARITAQLKHPNLPLTYDFGRLEDGKLYLVTELLIGEPFSHTLKNSALSVDETLDLLIQVSDALSVAHQQGVLHRDLKPSNIFSTVQEDGTVAYKVLDFGIAKYLGEEDQFGVVSEETQEGSFIGSPKYMAPERFKHQNVYTYESDLYSLGVIMFLCLTKRYPFNADNVFSMAIEHLEKPIPQLELPHIPPRLEARLQELLEELLAKEPDERLGNAAELSSQATEIRKALVLGMYHGADPEVLKELAQRRARRRILIYICMILLITSIGVFYLNLQKSNPTTMHSDSRHLTLDQSDLQAGHTQPDDYHFSDIAGGTSLTEVVLKAPNIERNTTPSLTAQTNPPKKQTPTQPATATQQAKKKRRSKSVKKSKRSTRAKRRKKITASNQTTTISRTPKTSAQPEPTPPSLPTPSTTQPIVPPRSIQLTITPKKPTYLVGENVQVVAVPLGGSGGNRAPKFSLKGGIRKKGKSYLLTSEGAVKISACVQNVCAKRSLIVFSNVLDDL